MFPLVMNTVFYHDLTIRNAKSIVGTIIHHSFYPWQILEYDYSLDRFKMNSRSLIIE